MEKTLFKSAGLDLEQAEQWARENLKENGIDEPSDEEVNDEVYSLEEMNYDDARLNLNKRLNGRIVAIADVGTWRGRFSGYKLMGSNLNEVLDFGSCDYINVYADQYNVKADMYHHDGVHHVEYRELKENTNYDLLLDKLYDQEEVTREDIRKYTKSLRPYIKQVYGF